MMDIDSEIRKLREVISTKRAAVGRAYEQSRPALIAAGQRATSMLEHLPPAAEDERRRRILRIASKVHWKLFAPYAGKIYALSPRREEVRLLELELLLKRRVAILTLLDTVITVAQERERRIMTGELKLLPAMACG